MPKLYWEDIREGTEIPSKKKFISVMEFNRFASGNDEFYMYHMEPEYAKSLGFPDVIIMGTLRLAYMSSLVSDWIGVDGDLKKIACQHRGMDVRNSTITLGGKVTRKYQAQGEHLADCELWVTNEKGERTCPGTATVVLPSKSSGRAA